VEILEQQSTCSLTKRKMGGVQQCRTCKNVHLLWPSIKVTHPKVFVKNYCRSYQPCQIMASVQPLHLNHMANSATLTDEILMIMIANRSKDYQHTLHPPPPHTQMIKNKFDRKKKNQHFLEEYIIYI